MKFALMDASDMMLESGCLSMNSLGNIDPVVEFESLTWLFVHRGVLAPQITEIEKT